MGQCLTLNDNSDRPKKTILMEFFELRITLLESETKNRVLYLFVW